MKALKALGSFVLFALSLLVGGLVLVDLWGWFVVPLGVPALAFWHALGLRITLAYFTLNLDDHINREKTMPYGQRCAISMFFSVIIWCMAWVYAWFGGLL